MSCEKDAMNKWTRQVANDLGWDTSQTSDNLLAATAARRGALLEKPPENETAKAMVLGGTFLLHELMRKDGFLLLRPSHVGTTGLPSVAQQQGYTAYLQAMAERGMLSSERMQDIASDKRQNATMRMMASAMEITNGAAIKARGLSLTPPEPRPVVATPEVAVSTSPVSLNTASASDIVVRTGLSAAIAERIVSERAKGAFKNETDTWRRVAGLSQSRMKPLRDALSYDQSPETAGNGNAQPTVSDSTDAAQSVSLNTSSATDIAAITGLSAAIAERIVSERAKGAFKNETDTWRRVAGLSQSRMKPLRGMFSYSTVDIAGLGTQNCPKCGEFMGQGHVCKAKADDVPETSVAAEQVAAADRPTEQQLLDAYDALPLKQQLLFDLLTPPQYAGMLLTTERTKQWLAQHGESTKPHDVAVRELLESRGTNTSDSPDTPPTTVADDNQNVPPTTVADDSPDTPPTATSGREAFIQAYHDAMQEGIRKPEWSDKVWVGSVLATSAGFPDAWFERRLGMLTEDGDNMMREFLTQEGYADLLPPVDIDKNYIPTTMQGEDAQQYAIDFAKNDTEDNQLDRSPIVQFGTLLAAGAIGQWRPTSKNEDDLEIWQHLFARTGLPMPAPEPVPSLRQSAGALPLTTWGKPTQHKVEMWLATKGAWLKDICDGDSDIASAWLSEYTARTNNIAAIRQLDAVVSEIIASQTPNKQRRASPVSIKAVQLPSYHIASGLQQHRVDRIMKMDTPDSVLRDWATARKRTQLRPASHGSHADADVRQRMEEAVMDIDAQLRDVSAPRINAGANLLALAQRAQRAIHNHSASEDDWRNMERERIQYSTAGYRREVNEATLLQQRSELAWQALFGEQPQVAASVKSTTKQPRPVADAARAFVQTSAGSHIAASMAQVSFNVLQEGERAYYHSDTGVHISPDDNTGVAVHELGHWVEVEHKASAVVCQTFLERRTAHTQEQSMSVVANKESYRSDEVGREGYFRSPYIGKSYSSANTEVLSMGLEYMHDDPVAFAREDPDHFDAIMQALRATRLGFS